ncbi:hypothetical protein FRC10_006312, partial [Ceratobasidium sp. 414]
MSKFHFNDNVYMPSAMAEPLISNKAQQLIVLEALLFLALVDVMKLVTEYKWCQLLQ